MARSTWSGWPTSSRFLLPGRAPRVAGPADARLRGADESELQAARRLAVALDGTTLAIQGPPGSGKTYTGARMILSLVAAGCRVGISSNGHKVTEDGQGVDFEDVTVTPSNDIVRDALRDGTFDVVGGTSWLWASDKSRGLVDVLFVDEAGQVALANVLAMAGAASSIVLLGDPQQLDQPLQGSHPPGADRSALAHLLDGRATIDDALGLFLEHTHRLHPEITRFTSTAFYDDRLESRPDLANQSLHGPVPLRGVGVRYLPSDHIGADSLS